MDLHQIAAALGGVVQNGSVLAPGPGHSPADRGLSVKLDVNAPDGFLVYSFANDDPITCKDYVREKCGFPIFAAHGNGKRPRRRTSKEIQAAMAAIMATERQSTAKGILTKTYNYIGADGTLLYQALRYDHPKSFSAAASKRRWRLDLEAR